MMFPPAVRWKVITRDRHRCQWCGDAIDFEAFAGYTVVRRADNGSREKWADRASNGVLCCTDCATWIRQHPDEATVSGFTVIGAHPSTVPIHTITRGIVLLDDAGNCVSQEVPW